MSSSLKPLGYLLFLAVFFIGLSGCGGDDSKSSAGEDEKQTPTNTEAAEEPINKPDPGVVDRAAICASLDNSAKCAEAIAREITASHPGVFEIVPGELQVSLLDGGSRNFQNTVVPEGEYAPDTYTYHRVVNYYPEYEMVLIEVQYYEGGEFMLLSRQSGQTENVFGEPVFSPDHGYFATFNGDIEAGYSVNGFEIWQMGDGFPQRVYSEKPTDWAPSNSEWQNPTTLDIERYTIDPEAEYHRKELSRKRLLLDDNGNWKPVN